MHGTLSVTYGSHLHTNHTLRYTHESQLHTNNTLEFTFGLSHFQATRAISIACRSHTLVTLFTLCMDLISRMHPLKILQEGRGPGISHIGVPQN